jgi:hypothetical protein
MPTTPTSEASPEHPLHSQAPALDQRSGSHSQQKTKTGGDRRRHTYLYSTSKPALSYCAGTSHLPLVAGIAGGSSFTSGPSLSRILSVTDQGEREGEGGKVRSTLMKDATYCNVDRALLAHTARSRTVHVIAVLCVTSALALSRSCVNKQHDHCGSLASPRYGTYRPIYLHDLPFNMRLGNHKWLPSSSELVY